MEFIVADFMIKTGRISYLLSTETNQYLHQFLHAGSQIRRDNKTASDIWCTSVPATRGMLIGPVLCAGFADELIIFCSIKE